MALSELCPDCQGTGWVRVETRFGTAAKRCKCYREELENARYLECGLPARIAHLTFDNFSAGDYLKERQRYNTLTAAMNKAKRFAEAFPISKRKGLLFHGGPTTEMTHLAVATLKLFVDKGFSCMFCDYQLLLETILERSDPEAAIAEASKAFSRRILDVDVLLIDSLGERRPSAWTIDTMSGIIKHRYYNERCLLATTALPLKEVSRVSPEGFHEMRAYSPLHDALGDRIGQESVHRLLDHCDGVCMSLPDQGLAGGVRR